MKHISKDGVKRLNLGSGQNPLKGWINVDLYSDVSGTVKMDVRQLEYPDNYADEILAHMIIEHLPKKDVLPSLKEWNRVLKPDGKIIIATIDLDGLCRDWLDKEKTVEIEGRETDYTYNLRGFYGHQSDEGQFHHIGFDFPFLHKLMTEAGFIKINLLPTNHTHHLYVEARK